LGDRLSIRGRNRRAGFSEAQITAMVEPGVSSSWCPRDQLIVRLADELHYTSTISDTLWADPRPDFQDELILLSGFYHTVSFLTNGPKLTLERRAALFPQVARDA
jgi:hypothetical protein